MTFEQWFEQRFPDHAAILAMGDAAGYMDSLIPRRFYSATQEAWIAATLVEREACAKVCEELTAYQEDYPGESFAAAIRARKE